MFLPLPKDDNAASPDPPTTDPTPADPPVVSPPRRFHTIHDAAAWIETNWPDFDLEATHPVTWRGEPGR